MNVVQMCNLRDLDPASVRRDPWVNAIVPNYYGFRIQDNGSFEAADIPSGNYDLIIELRETLPGEQFPIMRGKPIGTFQKQIQINGTEEIDLGEITLSDQPIVRARF